MNQKLMMRYLFSLSITLLALSNVFGVPVGDTKAIKLVKKSFKTDKKVNLEVSNKYGQIIINSWSKDSVVIKIKVAAYGKDKEASNKLLDRVEFDFNRAGEFIVAETVLDRSKGLLRDIWDDFNNYSKGLLGKNKLTINYEIYAPKYANINIIEKFGDIYLDNFKGDIKVELANGNLKCDEITGDLNLDLSFGRANINHIKKGVFTLRSAEVEMESAIDIDLASSSSSLTIANLNLLNIKSRNDKLKIDSLQVLRGNGSFSRINIKSMALTVFADMNYGELNIDNVSQGFKDIELVGKSTDFNLMFTRNSLVDINLVAKEEEMTLGYGDYEKSKYQEDEKLIEVKGSLGIGKEKNGLVNIHADGGRLILQYDLK